MSMDILNHHGKGVPHQGSQAQSHQKAQPGIDPGPFLPKRGLQEYRFFSLNTHTAISSSPMANYLARRAFKLGRDVALSFVFKPWTRSLVGTKMTPQCPIQGSEGQPVQGLTYRTPGRGCPCPWRET